MAQAGCSKRRRISSGAVEGTFEIGDLEVDVADLNTGGDWPGRLRGWRIIRRDTGVDFILSAASNRNRVHR
jgi:hypothetical protein